MLKTEPRIKGYVACLFKKLSVNLSEHFQLFNFCKSLFSKKLEQCTDGQFTVSIVMVFRATNPTSNILFKASPCK